MHTFQTPIPHKNWLGKLVFFLLFFTFWSLIRLIWRQMCWISIVGVSSNIIILESSNYKILSIFYYVYQTMWNTDNLNQQNFTSNCTLTLNEKKNSKRNSIRNLYWPSFASFTNLKLSPPCREKTIYANTQSS